jgi:hypothetical protein
MFGYSNQQSQCQPGMRAYLAQSEKVYALSTRCIVNPRQTRILLDTISVSKVSKQTNVTGDSRAIAYLASI